MKKRVNMVICVASLLAICAGVAMGQLSPAQMSCPDPCGGKRACPAGTVTGCNAGVCVCEPISN
jgi:hypothetical protein